MSKRWFILIAVVPMLLGAAVVGSTAPKPACSQWAVRQFTSEAKFGETAALPEGWEPFSASGSGSNVYLRQCVK